MGHLDSSDIVLLVIAGYIAVISLVRLMLRHRDQVAAQVREQFDNERRRKLKKKRRAARAEQLKQQELQVQQQLQAQQEQLQQQQPEQDDQAA